MSHCVYKADGVYTCRQVNEPTTIIYEEGRMSEGFGEFDEIQTGGVLQQGGVLFITPGKKLYSTSRNYYLEFTTKGELVTKNGTNNIVFWSAGVSASYPVKAEFKPADGNLVLWKAQDESLSTGVQKYWESITSTYNKPSMTTFMMMQTDGNLVIYQNNWVPIWSSINVQASLQRYPPTQIGPGSTWTKDLSDTFQGLAKYKYTVTSATTWIDGNALYGGGQYVAYANDIYGYQANTSYWYDEWPPSGAFDTLDGRGSNKSGWASSSALTISADSTNPPTLYLQLPYAIILKTYTLSCRSDCCVSQMATKWSVEGSNDNGQTWTILDTRADIRDWVIGQTKTFVVSNTSYFKVYRIKMLRNNSSVATVVSIGEWALYAPPW